jgi:hypothetical protein
MPFFRGIISKAYYFCMVLQDISKKGLATPPCSRSAWCRSLGGVISKAFADVSLGPENKERS